MGALRGYIFKRGSPSCGMERVKVYGAPGKSPRAGRGLFAHAVMQAHPLLPCEEEGRLNDAPLRESFVERVFAYDRWLRAMAGGLTPGRIVEFHTRHKLLLLSHSEIHYRAAGRLVADAGRRERAWLAGEYLSTFMEGMRRRATRRRHTNVLQHLAGYLKRSIDSQDRQALAAIIEEYRTGVVPLVVPIRFLRHYFRRARTATSRCSTIWSRIPTSSGSETVSDPDTGDPGDRSGCATRHRIVENRNRLRKPDEPCQKVGAGLEEALRGCRRTRVCRRGASRRRRGSRRVMPPPRYRLASRWIHILPSGACLVGQDTVSKRRESRRTIRAPIDSPDHKESEAMTFVVIDKCIKCKYTDCVEVCPVDCFHEGPNMLVIDPEECIDCTLCEPECPVEAILSEDDLTDDQQEWLSLNDELSRDWPVLAEKKDAPEDAEEWENVEGKIQHLER